MIQSSEVCFMKRDSQLIVLPLGLLWFISALLCGNESSDDILPKK